MDINSTIYAIFIGDIHMEVVETEFGGIPLSIETGRMAKQANGSTVVRYGDTMVLVTATAAKGDGAENDFFPLSVHYIEKTYSAGKIPGGFFKREGRLSDHETLVSRFIDRPLRPMFDKNYHAETVIQATVLSYDPSCNPDVAAMIGASASLMVSDIPFESPVCGIRIGYVDEQFIANPTGDQLFESQLDIFMAGSKDAILMVEGEAEEVSEQIVLEAILFGHEQIQPLLVLQEELAQKSGKTKREITPSEKNKEIQSKVEDFAIAKIQSALNTKEKQARYELMDTIAEETQSQFSAEELEEFGEEISHTLGEIKKREMRSKILEDGIRIDGRAPNEIRDITCEIGVLPRAHGSSLFTRGETQALVVTTLGTKDDEQMVDSLDGMGYKQFLLHYNFPPFSVGEARAPRAPGRREIGHGFLAEKGLNAVLPDYEDFPYTIRLVSEILESNGSSSMASVCGGSLALLDAGVNIKAPTAGIAMGLIYEGENKTAILSDILGDEDHLGDMDFKVVGTEKGITALQMDIKITGITKEIFSTALEQAKEGRIHILNVMNDTLQKPKEISQFAPQKVNYHVDPDKIRDVIGPGGKVIKGIIEKTGVKMNIDDSGKVTISSTNMDAINHAIELIKEIVPVPKIGQVYHGKVMKVTDFGAFVEILPGLQGLVHISNMANHRIRRVTDIVREGDQVDVKLMGFDKRGKTQLSMKDVVQNEA